MNTKLLFLHIPKAGGTTFYEVLDNQYPKRTIYTFHIVQGRSAHEMFIDLPIEEKEKLKLLRGHMFFGFHQYFQSPCKYITFLREPIARVISSYFYILKRPSHYIYEEVKKMTLEEYAASNITGELNNLQTQYISGERLKTAPLTEEVFAKAKLNLDNYFIIAGTLDKFDETLILLKDKLGWKKYPAYYVKNTTTEEQSKANISEEAKKIIAERNQYDIALYNYVKQKLESEIEEKKKFIEQELKILSAKNRSYKIYGNFKEFIKKTIGRK